MNVSWPELAFCWSASGISPLKLLFRKSLQEAYEINVTIVQRHDASVADNINCSLVGHQLCVWLTGLLIGSRLQVIREWVHSTCCCSDSCTQKPTNQNIKRSNGYFKCSDVFGGINAKYWAEICVKYTSSSNIMYLLRRLCYLQDLEVHKLA